MASVTHSRSPSAIIAHVGRAICCRPRSPSFSPHPDSTVPFLAAAIALLDDLPAGMPGTFCSGAARPSWERPSTKSFCSPIPIGGGRGAGIRVPSFCARSRAAISRPMLDLRRAARRAGRRSNAFSPASAYAPKVSIEPLVAIYRTHSATSDESPCCRVSRPNSTTAPRGPLDHCCLSIQRAVAAGGRRNPGGLGHRRAFTARSGPSAPASARLSALAGRRVAARSSQSREYRHMLFIGLTETYCRRRHRHAGDLVRRRRRPIRCRRARPKPASSTSPASPGASRARIGG